MFFIEVITKATVSMSVAMYVLRQLEYAIDNCAASRADDSLRALDEAVAFYTGSVGSVNASGSFVFNLAAVGCVNFKTCGTTGDQIQGDAKINVDITAQFSLMKESLANSKNCTAARLVKEKIAKKIVVPLIQGALRYGYMQTLSASAKAEAAGAIFAAAVLPVVAKCNATSAATIYEELKTNSGNTVDFVAVKLAFESNYQCIGITCLDVGGLYDRGNLKFFANAEPCGGNSEPVEPTPERKTIFQRFFDIFRNLFSFLGFN
jgi:hypothetical protein